MKPFSARLFLKIMPQFNFSNRMFRARPSVRGGVAGLVSCFGKKPAGERFLKKWLGICNLLGSLSPSREQIGVKS
jgi:hypothetical protein